jgi:2'-5' RNA ligase
LILQSSISNPIMRAFIAIALPDEIHRELARQQAAFRAACPDARWTRAEGIHLTLKFLGEISEPQVKQVTAALAPLGNFSRFKVEVKGFGCFPDARRPRVFWAGVAAPPDLARLATGVEDAMAPLGFEREQRTYNPHLTLARFNNPRPQPRLQEAIAMQAGVSLGQFEASEFFLFESRLSPGGAEYRKVARFSEKPSVSDFEFPVSNL